MSGRTRALIATTVRGRHDKAFDGACEGLSRRHVHPPRPRGELDSTSPPAEAMSVRHVVLTNPGSHGFQFGVLRHFEDEIIRLTGAERVAVPAWRAPLHVRKRLAHGTRYAFLRDYVPRRQRFDLRADVAWSIQMGPEDTDLDLLTDWDRSAGYRILYLYDTFPRQLPAVRRIMSRARWDLAITSYHSAVPMLEEATGRKWHAIAQGVAADHFAPLAEGERSIALSSYGRRLPEAHQVIAAWAQKRGLYYDVSTAAAPQLELDPRFLYDQYAWHVRHSMFSVCWPVELTHPARAGGLSPVTCRWFEAAASGAILVGEAPKDPVFEELFGTTAVVPLPHAASERDLSDCLDALWQDRHRHFARAERLRHERLHLWTWEARVREILELAGLSSQEGARS